MKTQTQIPTGQINELTGLRGVACLWVVLFHFQYGFLFCPSFYDLFFRNRFVQKGYLAVDFFFVLSGFVMAFSAESWRGERPVGYFLQFMRVRLARIYPLHLLTLLMMVGFYLASTGTTQNFYDSLWAHLTLTHAWGKWHRPDFNYPSWSISAEMAAYLSFPATLVLNRIIAKKPWALVGLMLIVSGLLIWISHTFNQSAFDLTEVWGWARCLIEFWIGLSLYQLWPQLKPLSGGVKNLISIALILGFVCFIFLKANDAWILLIASGTIASLAAGSNVWHRLLGNRVSVALGRVSYSIYMLHVPVGLQLLKLWGAKFGNDEPIWQGTLGVVFALSLLIATSFTTYRFFELPLRNYFSGRMKR